MKGDNYDVIPLIKVDFSFLTALHPAVSIVFLIGFFTTACLSIRYFYLYCRKKEEHIHSETTRRGQELVTIVEIIFRMFSHPPSDDSADQKSDFPAQYKENITRNVLKELEQRSADDLAPVRKKRCKKRTKNRQSKGKGVKS